ncbi:methylated-DNA--[protein]-cysteine S-methyltransferase [Gaiella sp.]|uniref:methylated-DNA--[protein]-cysteine S-methyltransferase n=1 Tax=Gaiella sp. TaxID=2663207 RepID=UPI0039834EF7
MRVTRFPYEIPGWGVGEIWVRDGIVVQHELASEEIRACSPGFAEGFAGQPVGISGHGSSGPRAEPSDPATWCRNGGAGLPTGNVAGKPRRKRADIVSDLSRRIEAHLNGVPTSYDGVVIDLAWATPLQRELAVAARAIPWGEVVSYGDLAALAGRPGAARAAGSFCADNRYSLIIPCHRVVAANGIGGYGAAGPALKLRLLTLEGVNL